MNDRSIPRITNEGCSIRQLSNDSNALFRRLTMDMSMVSRLQGRATSISKIHEERLRSYYIRAYHRIYISRRIFSIHLYIVRISISNRGENIITFLYRRLFFLSNTSTILEVRRSSTYIQRVDRSIGHHFSNIAEDHHRSRSFFHTTILFNKDHRRMERSQGNRIFRNSNQSIRRFRVIISTNFRWQGSTKIVGFIIMNYVSTVFRFFLDRIIRRFLRRVMDWFLVDRIKRTVRYSIRDQGIVKRMRSTI